MVQRLRKQLTYANVMATVAVFIALGGTAYAITDNSILSRHIRAGEVKTSDIANSHVTSTDILDETVQLRDLAGEARRVHVAQAEFQHNFGQELIGDSVACPSGTRVVGGGGQLNGVLSGFWPIQVSKPTAENGWAVVFGRVTTGDGHNRPDRPATAIIYALCLKVS